MKSKTMKHRVNDVKLITLVQKHEILYNMHHKEYNDNAQKELVWNQIGNTLGHPATACKMRWFNLRDQYRRVLRTSSGRKRWRLDEEMSFLKPYYRKDIINSGDDSTNSSIQQTSASLLKTEIPDSNFSLETPEPEEIVQSKEDVVENEEQNHRTDICPHIQVTSKVHKGNDNQEGQSHDFLSATLMKLLTEQAKLNRIPSKPKDAVDAFMSSLGETIKTFPPIYQHLAKNKIFAIISDIEMEILTKQQQQTQHQIVDHETSVNKSTVGDGSLNHSSTGLASTSQPVEYTYRIEDSQFLSADVQ